MTIFIIIVVIIMITIIIIIVKVTVCRQVVMEVMTKWQESQ